MLNKISLFQRADPAWLRMVLAGVVFVAASLSCSLGQESDQQKATSAPAGSVTQNPLYLPEVQSGGGQATGGSAGGQTTPNTLFLPQVSSGSGQPTGPQVQVEASASTLKVGETVTVTGRVTGVGKTIYILAIQDAGTAEVEPLAQVNAANEAQSQEGASQVLELLSAEGNAETATFILRAKAVGTAAVNVTATGDLQGESGSTSWSGTGTQPIMISVNE